MLFCWILLFLRIIVLWLYFRPENASKDRDKILISQLALFSAFGGTIRYSIHTKEIFIISYFFLFMLVLGIITVIIYTHIFNLLLLLIVFGVIVYWTIKKIGYAVEVVKLTEKTMHLIMKNIRIWSSVDDDNWDADRTTMMNIMYNM